MEWFNDMSMTWISIGRLAMAGMLGTLIGMERAYRAKEAGMRTHFLVSLGSALLMLVSQYGFAGAENFDASRVAAQIVSGIGFIGAGTIMMQKQFVRGLTTAAGLWVAAGIGMAIGGGMYILGSVATLFALLGLEALQQIFHRFNSKNTQLIFTTAHPSDLVKITAALHDRNCQVMNCSVADTADGKRLRVKIMIYEQNHESDANLVRLLKDFRGVFIEKIE